MELSSPLLQLNQSPCDFGVIDELDDLNNAKHSSIVADLNDLNGVRESLKSNEMTFSRDIA